MYRTLKAIASYAGADSSKKGSIPHKLTVDYETVKLPYTIPKIYIPDFIITKPNGSVLYIEVKGYFRQPDRSKILSVLADNPLVDLRIVFEKNNKLSRRHKMRYSDWCEKHNIPYAINAIPLEWFK